MLQRFFIFCSGADSDILDTCSKGEQNKYAGIGATVFFTAVMAFIASGYALYTVFDNVYIAIFFGFFCTELATLTSKSMCLELPFSWTKVTFWCDWRAWIFFQKIVGFLDAHI